MGAVSKLQTLSDPSAENKEVIGLKAQLKNLEDRFDGLQQSFTKVKEEAEATAKKTVDIQQQLKFTDATAEAVAGTLLPDHRDKLAAQFFLNFKSLAPNPLAKFFQSMGLNLETWHSWDKKYGKHVQAMVEAFECPQKHEGGELALIRSKLSTLGVDVDAINAIRDYRDLKITYDELKKRAGSHIIFDGDLPVANTIPDDLMPSLTNESLENGTEALDQANDATRKLQWLKVMKLLKPAAGVGVCLQKEIINTSNC